MTTALTAISDANGGYFTTAQAYDCGYDWRDLKRAVHGNLVRRFRRGTYAFADSWDPLSAEARHVVTLRAVIASMNGAVVASGVSACALRGLCCWGHDLLNVHVTRLDGGAGRREAGVVHHHGRVNDDQLEQIDGVIAVRADRAVCEAGSIATLEAGIVLYDSGLRDGCVTDESLGRRAAAMRRTPGTRKVRFGILLADGRSESPGESRNRFLFYRFGIPAPELQHSVHSSSNGRLIGITDFAWPLYCHLGEFDGLMKYQRSRNGDRDPAQVVADEKIREDELRAEHKGMTRTIWRDLDPPFDRRTADRTMADLERSYKLYANSRVTIAL
ncbi:MAG: type IV toxin-antitoxin system AbiEi family antitoxin domain-containing protein [Nocardioidaceae bacterium]